MVPAAEPRGGRSHHARPTGELPGPTSRNPLARHCPRLVPLNLVSSWAERSRLGLGQRKVDSQSNEFTVNPDLLGMPVPPVAPGRGGDVRSRTGSGLHRLPPSPSPDRKPGPRPYQTAPVPGTRGCRPLDMPSKTTRAGSAPAIPRTTCRSCGGWPAHLPCRETTTKACCAAKRTQASRNDGYLLKGSVELACDCPGPRRLSG